MKFGLSDSLFNKILETLKNDCFVYKACIFGSRAKNTYTNNSDIDLAIWSDNKLSASLKLELDEIVGLYKIDIVDMNLDLKSELLNSILNEGIVIYSKEKN